MSTESRTLQLKFLNEVSLPVLTGKEIEGKGGTAMRLGIVDNETQQRVTSGPEASAKVEVLLLQADDDDDEHNLSSEDFNNKIITESDKEKPHVAKGMHVRLKEGEAILSDVKLGHGSSWKKRCSCRLGARLVDNSNGSRVKEGWTESFMVEDRRGKLYGKHYPPSLLDEVWRLENIGRDGGPCKDLYKKKIFTVQDFRFLLSIDPQRLRKIFKGSKVWKAIVDHALTCVIDDKKIYLYSSPSKFNFVVAFDAVGQLMGIICNSHFVHLGNLSEVEQASARELLLLAFANREDITSVDDETSLVHQFPCESHDVGVSTDSVPNDEYADTSSPAIGPCICPSNNFSLIGSERMQQICDPSLPVRDQGPSSSTSALGSNQALRDPSLAVPDQGPSLSPIPLGSNEVSCDPSLIVPYQGPSSSLVPLGSNQRLCDPSLIVPDLGPIYSPIDLGFYPALSCPSLTLLDQGLMNDPGSYPALCDPFFTVRDQGPSPSLFAIGSKHALCDASLSFPDQGPSSSVIALGSCPASCDPSLTVPEQTSSDGLTDLNNLFERFGGNELISLFYHHNNNHSETCTESLSVQQSNAGSIRFFAAVGLTMWVSRVRKRVMGFCDFDVQKRQRIG
ncbi:calmodulin-binding protein 60 C-like isoform X2 [Henckelia pumila]